MTPLSPDTFYHIYNRANGNEKLFLSDDNYTWFLRQYTSYISPIADTYCYCLMPNHFHFLISIKEKDELLKSISKLRGDLETSLSNEFSKLFTSYAKAFNKQQSRKGSVFMKNFKRKIADDIEYRKKLVHYLHLNPVEAKICNDPGEWKYSSYNDLLAYNHTQLKRNEVIGWFDGRENFVRCHEESTKTIKVGEDLDGLG